MTLDEIAALAERAARVVTAGAGLKALAQLLADAASGVVLVEDDQWRHLALAQSGAGLGSLPASFAPYRDGVGEGAGQIARARVSDDVTALCAAVPGAADGDGACGYVTIFVRGKPHAALGAALRIVASAASVEVGRRGAGRAQMRRAFWERYLGGGFADAATLKEEAAAAGVSLAPSYLVALFDAEGAAPAALRSQLAQALAPAEALCPPVAAGGSVAALFPVRHQADVARARQAASNAVKDLLTQGVVRSLTCGIGGFRADPSEAPRSLAEARQALVLGRRLRGRGTVTTHADLGLHALLHEGADRESFARFAEQTIEPLVSYDRKHKTDLLKTLRLYFDVGENVKEAAEQLSVHRHTIFYRLNQIAQILKIDLRDADDQLGVRAALAIRRMQSEPDEER